MCVRDRMVATWKAVWGSAGCCDRRVGYRCGGRWFGLSSTLREGLLSTLGDDVSGIVAVLVGWLTAVSKMSASCRKAWSCSDPSCANGVVGDGFCNAWIKSLVAKMAASALDVLGISKAWGKNSIVLMILAAAVLDT